MKRRGAAATERYRPAISPAWLIFFLVALACRITPVLAAGPQFPALTGRIVDNANLLPPGEETRLESELETLERKTTDQLVIVTLPGLQGYPIEDFGYRLGRHWAIGQQGKDNGVLLIVAPKERKVRIEVGQGIEGELTDAMSKLIIENAILPRFRAGDFPGGISDGVRDIIAVMTGDAEAVKLRARPAGDSGVPVMAIVFLIFWVLIFIFVIWSIVRSARQGVKGDKRKGKKSGGWVFGPGGSSGGGWSSGGGGFSGGGGSFGGGGASGGW